MDDLTNYDDDKYNKDKRANDVSRYPWFRLTIGLDGRPANVKAGAVQVQREPLAKETR